MAHSILAAVFVNRVGYSSELSGVIRWPTQMSGISATIWVNWVRFLV